MADHDLNKCRQSRVYDALMRLPILTWSATLAISSIMGLERYACRAKPALPGTVYAVNIAMRLSVVAYLVMIAGAALTRVPAIRKARGAEPRISAIIGTFLITVVVLFPRQELSLCGNIISTSLILAGNALAAVVLVQLRDSFSVMPEARQLITSGTYRFIRHPLYLAEEIAAVGVLIQFLSAWTAGLIIVQLVFQLRRMHHEEKLLTNVFSNYSTYKDLTSRFIPKIY